MSAYKGLYDGASRAAPRPKPEWHRVSKLHPRRWFGYTWYRVIEATAQVGGGADYWEYRTDKQMADEVLAQLAPKRFDSAGLWTCLRSS